MWAEFITPAAIAAIQHSFGPLWDIVRIMAVFAALISLGLLLAGGIVGIVIAALTPNAPVLKGALVGIGVAAGVVVIAGIGLAIAAVFHPTPTAMWLVGLAGLITASVCTAVLIIRRIGRNANPGV